MEQEITYDNNGRMYYHPDYHPNQGKPWTTKDQKYLIDYYEKLGPEQVSFDLGRTISTVMDRACVLRKNGIMDRPKVKKYHRRMNATSL